LIEAHTKGNYYIAKGIAPIFLKNVLVLAVDCFADINYPTDNIRKQFRAAK